MKKFIYQNQIQADTRIQKNMLFVKDFYILHKKLKDYFLKNNIFINDVIYCPFHKESLIKKFRKNSNFRKPGNLMIEKLIRLWPVNRQKSFMIGDQKSDQIAANKSSLYFKYAENQFNKLALKICKKKNI